MEEFIESGMTFGPYADEHCFRIETSKTYQAVQDRVKIAEFLLIRPKENVPPEVLIVEAKNSSPRPGNRVDFGEFIADIKDKMANALGLAVASILKRHPLAEEELPSLFKELALANAEFRLVLIINGHEKDWLPPLQDALRKALHATSRTWALGPNAVVVINHEDAKKFALISAP
jgi:hypothetical protein